jgi:ParB family chromosome partitioning protein
VTPERPSSSGGRRSGLGRGLGALIPQSTGGAGLLEVDVDRIAPNPWQPRLEIDEAGLAELMQSIREHGVLQPLIVTLADNDTYALVAGERRWRAAKAAGLLTVPVVVKETTPRQRLELALVENIQRQDLSPLETAQAYRQLIDEHSLTQEAVAERVGKSRAAVANALRLLQLPAPARDALARGLITEGHARAYLSCATPDLAAILLESILANGLSVRQAEELARRLNAAETEADAKTATEGAETEPAAVSVRPATRQLPPDAAAIEDRFRQALGTKVQLYKSRKGGRLVIHFFSDDELTGLYEAICGPEET